MLQGDDAVLDRVAPDVFDNPVDLGRLAACLAAPGHCLFVAIHEETVVAQCAGMVHRHPDKPTELYIDNLGVTPAMHRQGIARRLLEAIFAWGREHGCEEAWVGTEQDNGPAQALYLSLTEPCEGPSAFDMFVYDLRADGEPDGIAGDA